MKRVLTILALLLLPMSVWAMTPISDSDLSKVTGQAGVNINADLTMDIGLGTMAWGDADGIYGVYDVWATTAAGSGYNNGGYVGVNNFNITNLKIRARSEATDNYNGYSTLMLKPITIDVATGTKSYIDGTGAVTSGSVTFVRFGLGALQIGMDAMQFTVALDNRPGLAADGVLSELMGVVSMGDMEVYINPWSYVDIYAHAGMGVNFDVNVTLDRITLGYVSWGDTDGFPAGDAVGSTGSYWMAPGYLAGGYIGLTKFDLGDADNPAVTATGTVQIDVVTAYNGIYALLPQVAAALDAVPGLNLWDYDSVVAAAEYSDILLGDSTTPDPLNPGEYYSWIEVYLGSGSNPAVAAAIMAATGLTPANFTTGATRLAVLNNVSTNPTAYIAPVSVVHISFPTDFTVGVDQITADVVLSSAADLGTGGTAPFGTLGDIYIQGINMKIKPGSWIDIWAH